MKCPESPQTAGERTGAVLFFDLDGTLTAKKRGPSYAVLQAFETLRRNGHLAFLCTGRPLCHVDQKLRDAPLAGSITLAGGRIQVGEKVVQNKTIPRDLLCSTVEQFSRLGMTILFESSEACCVLSPSKSRLMPFSGTRRVTGIEEMEELFPQLPFSKMVFMDEELPKFEKEQEFFQKHYKVYDIAVGCHELTIPEINKRDAVLQVLKTLDRSREESYGFGDSENDLAMLETVGTAVAMGNALPTVKAMADYVTEPVDRDGVPAALRAFGLI
ncbi:MAG: Cof-type HAD-IIB family hydrolase [Oscillospiraceae bacterium]|nr:Cof-type HAD-IIB family hydrolase [Oscillospiraceae bacterium]